MKNLISTFNDGLTVSEFKAIVEDWPEVDSDGCLTEVWIGDGEGLTNIVTHIVPLNSDGCSADLLLESNS